MIEPSVDAFFHSMLGPWWDPVRTFVWTLVKIVLIAVPPGVVRVAAAHPSTCGLDGLSGPVTLERA